MNGKEERREPLLFVSFGLPAVRSSELCGALPGQGQNGEENRPGQEQNTAAGHMGPALRGTTLPSTS